MGVPSQPLPDIGKPNSTEDAKVRSALAELQTILSNGLDASNLVTGAVTLPKLATEVSNGFLKLLTAGDHKLAFGQANATFVGTNRLRATVNHGLPNTPVWADAVMLDIGNSFLNYHFIGLGLRSTTQVMFDFEGVNGTTAGAGNNVDILWVAIS